jgi:hypothetical protein
LNKTQVNTLVAEYRDGNELALDEIFRKVNPFIENASMIIEKASDDVTKFDCRVLLKIKKAMDDPSVRDFAGYVKTIIGNEKSDFLTRRKRKRKDLSMTSLEGDGDEELGYQFESTSNTVDDVLFKEQVTLLAQGNRIKELILDQWSKGARDSSISVMLAHQFGGNSESHRKTIQRFRNDCKIRLDPELS